MSRKISIVLFLLLGIITIYMGLNVDLKCPEATVRDNLLAGIPLTLFGIYSIFTSLFLWKKPQIGNTMAVIVVTVAIIMLIAAIFDFSFQVIKTSCRI